MRFLVDMNLSPRWVDHLAEAGIEAAHWSQLGPATASDDVIMAFAAANDFVVITHDLDFSAILAASRGQKPSVVQLRSDNLQPQKIGKLVIAALNQAAQELEQGAVLVVDVHRTRLRLLPLTASS
jgi:predicted nuclease of predicted toxin-antitoxin system